VQDQAARIVHALGGTWKGDFAMCKCPAHDDRTPSLSVSIGNTAVLYHCFAGCTADAILEAVRSLLHTKPDGCNHVHQPARRAPGNFSIARQLWDAGEPLAGTPAARYLERRGISILSGFARFLAEAVTYDGDTKVTHPALLLPITASDGMAGLQRIFLTEDGHKAAISEPKKNLGTRTRNGAIRYGGLPDDGTLHLAEGFEDAASVMALHGVPHCWAVCGIERYRLVEIPETVRQVTLWSQHGAEAERAISSAMTHLRQNGRAVAIMLPEPGMDWNDMLVSRNPTSTFADDDRRAPAPASVREAR
jgi:hypothetical protein